MVSQTKAGAEAAARIRLRAQIRASVHGVMITRYVFPPLKQLNIPKRSLGQ